MELRHFRYFLALAEECHFGRAAQRLHVVQPALSMQIRDLEAELGVSLFRRTSRRVELTEAGRLFRVEAERTIRQAEQAILVAKRAGKGEIGSVRVGFVGNAAFAGKLSADLRIFRDRHPEVELILREMPAATQAEALADRQIDVGYCPQFGQEFGPGLAVAPVGSWPWLVALSEQHRLCSRAHIVPADLKGERIIPYAAASGREQILLPQLLLQPGTLLTAPVASTLTVLAMAAAGLGIAVVPETVGDVRLPGIAYRPFRAALPPAAMVLISRRDEDAPPVQAYVAVAAAGDR